MAWTIEFEAEALRELKRLGTEPARRIVCTMEQRIASLEDARKIGDALVGAWSGYWRYRIGDYRVIARIEDDRLVITVMRVTHRRHVYR